MFKQTFPKPISQMPTVGGLRSTNIIESSESRKNVFNPPLTKPMQSPIHHTPSQPQIESTKEEELFKDMVKEKLGKIDEFLISIKEKQDQLLSSNPSSQQVSIPQLSKGTPKGRSKKTYYKITDTMWNDIKSSFVDLPEAYKNNAYSDGTSYYVEHKNKKILLDGKGYLKILNDK